MLNRWKDPLATQPERENEMTQTNRGVQGICVGVVPRVQSKPSRAHHAHRWKKLLQALQNLENTTMKRAMVRTAKKGCHGIYGMPGVSQEDTVEGPL